MRMEYGLRLETTQKLFMTPQLCQAIAILQLSALELSALVDKQLLENPVLEVDDKTSEAEEPPQGDKDPIGEYFDWMEYFNDGTDTGKVSINKEEKPSLEAYVASTESLIQHLQLQLALTSLDRERRYIGEYLIGCIEDNGYLVVSVEDVAQVLSVDVNIVNDVLATIQTFEPMGVGARNLSECLKIQVRARNITNPLVEVIIDQYLPDVADGKIKVVAEKLACTAHEIQEAVDIIRTLDPKPGRPFGGGQPNYIVPDVTVKKVNGAFVIVVNEGVVPQLIINPYYRQAVRTEDTGAKKFVEGRINSALWLIKSIDQRRRTLYSVVESIIELQYDFFEYGPKHIRPLTMKRVADQLGINESTVSRTIANKYIDTPHGIYNMKTFFTVGVESVCGDISAACVKQEINEMINNEDHHQPLSDQAITNQLADKGINVSRRTVAKYREELGILSSSKRKRY